MDLSEYFAPLKPVVASRDETPDPEVARILLQRHRVPQTMVPWEKVKLDLAL